MEFIKKNICELVSKNKTYKIILSGGGTGGHIYPAIAIANELKARHPKAELLFVGAKDRMEMEKVPKQVIKLLDCGFLVFKES